MVTPAHAANREIIDYYLGQAAELPLVVRTAIQKEWRDQPIQLYALADLDASLRLAHTWVAIGPTHLALVREHDGTVHSLQSIERTRIESLRETPGLSATMLTLLGSPGEPAIAVLRYTHRQRRAMETIKFLLEQQIEGTAIEPTEEADHVYAEALATPVKDAQAAVSGNKLAVVWRLLGYLRPYKRQVIIASLAATIFTLLGLLPPFITGLLLDRVVRPYQEGAISFNDAQRNGWLLVGAIALSYTLFELFSFVRLRYSCHLGDNVARDLRHAVYAHLQRLSLTYFSKKQTGSIISRVSNDTDRLWDFVAFGIIEVSLAVIKLMALGAVLLYLDWKLGLAMLLPIPLLLYAIFRHYTQMQGLFLRAWRKWSDMTDVLSDTIPGIRVVKAFNQSDRETRRFQERNANCSLEFNAINAKWTAFWPRLVMGVHCIVIAIWALALPRLITSTNAPTLSTGTFVSFILYMTMFFQPIDVIGQVARMMNRATSSALRIFEVLDTEPQIVNNEKSIRLEPVQGRVTFDNVTFSYDGVRQVIKGVSFDVQPGELIGLVGPSGAGKSTVTNLIVRFYEATSGQILIDGVPLKDLDQGHFRTQVGMVLQDPYLFHGTVLDNIRYANPQAPMDEVISAARAANAHDFICKLPHGYDTVVGERGQTLSGGERQRVSIARAILANPRILILDEATSSVDTETERKIQEALDRLVKGRTVFAIAHRLSTLRKATRLFVIEDGRITEEGTHAELIEKEEGTYKKLHDLQQELHEMYAV